MVLVNGISAGIGTGWSCSIPSYNIIELISILKKLLENNEPNFEIKPYYRNFQGTVEVEGTKVITKGVYEVVDEKKRKYKITEIPLGKKNISISKYKTILEDLQEAGKIKDIVNHCDSELVNFTVTASEDFEVNHESLGLVDTTYLNNMVMFDKDDKIKKYENIEEIIREYYSIRYDFYKVRKDGLIKNMEKELLFLRNKINFLECVLNNKITLKDKSMQSLEEELLKRKFDKIDDSYEYLLSIQVRHMTGEKLAEIKEKEKKLNKAYDEYKKKKIETIWIEELDELLERYVKWEKENTVSKTDRQEQKKK
jgi:DNA topoisomerase-2